MPLIFNSSAFEVRETTSRGRGVFALTPLPASTVLFKESPLVAIQHRSNRTAGVQVCEHCFRFLGPLEEQIRSLLAGAGRPSATVPSYLPPVVGIPMMPSPVHCPGGCSLRFCSAECASANFEEQHQLLCHGSRHAPGQPGASSGSVTDEDGGLQDMMIDMQISPNSDLLALFEGHAAQSNEIFLMAAKALALVLCSVRRGASLSSALEPFPGPVWWESIATPDDVSDEAPFRSMLRELVTESWQLLVPVLSPQAPAECVSLFSDPLVYARIVGSFERRNCAVQVASPVESYFLAVDDLPEGEQKGQLVAITSPVLDALDEAYSTPCEGTGIFPLQVTPHT